MAVNGNGNGIETGDGVMGGISDDNGIRLNEAGRSTDMPGEAWRREREEESK